MSATPQQAVRDDFDRIAGLEPPRWDHNVHYHAHLLRLLPASCDAILDVGCGAGAFTRLLAPRARTVTGVDFSPEMIRRARAGAAVLPNVMFVKADVLQLDWPEGSLDAIVTIAALHHVPLREALERMRRWLRPGGRLVALDVLARDRAIDLVWRVPAKAASLVHSLARNGRLVPDRATRLAWEQHARLDQLPSLADVRSTVADVLPGANVRQHLLWRWSLEWTRPRSD